MKFSRLREIAVRPWSLEAAKDLDAERQRQATAESARFVDEHLAHVRGWRGATAHAAKLAMLRWAIEEAPGDGLAVEFGVATGETLRLIADQRPVHGFDSFAGLPENWYGDYQAGTFAQNAPEVPNAEVHVGWFNDTLPGFLAEHPEPFAFVHMDADLYASTKTVFDLAFDRFVAGTVIVFDEYLNYPGWRQHEHKAFSEFVEKSGHEVDYLAYNAMHEQVAVRLR